MQNNVLSERSSISGAETVKFDIIAAVVVTLVAIPLCLGIALASGAPLFSGIISGIIGGIIVGTLSNSQISVSGPAAGMAAVVLAAITELGGFNVFLVALTFAGLIQLVIGLLRAGFIAEYVPSNVVQGLLCAIGILLIVKQIPFTISLSSTAPELNSVLQQATETVTLKPFFHLLSHINTGTAIISFISFIILIFFEKTENKWLKSIPAPIVVVIGGIMLNEFFIQIMPIFAQEHPNLVNIPVHDGIGDLASQLQFPNWAVYKNPHIYFYALIIAIVASLESLLNIKASEKIDTERRHCSKNRELIAQGIGNTISGLIGGIPVTSVILRTSVNIQSGGKTKLSPILHGFYLLIAILLIPKTLNLIPLASLAVILIMTGYKLTKPKIYRDMYHQGSDRFIPFIITVLGIIFLDMLLGIIIGLSISLFYILRSNSRARMDIIQEQHPTGILNRLILPQQVSFLNKAALFAELDTIPKGSKLIIDARHTSFIDKEIIELIKEFQIEARLRNISLNLIGFKEHYDIHDHIDFIHVTTYDVQNLLTPKQVLIVLQEGNKRFCEDARIHRSTQMDIRFTAKTQHPIAVVLACMDSRVPVETVFDMSFGDLFCIRIAGNVVNDDILASLEYACHVIGAKLIVVLGHTRCGAIQAACDHVSTGHITSLLHKIQPSVTAYDAQKNAGTAGEHDAMLAITQLNIANTLSAIYEQSTILAHMINDDAINMVGALYDVSSGEVSFNNYSEEFAELGITSPALTKQLTALF